jgi:DNA-binding response OmpR family regulator
MHTLIIAQNLQQATFIKKGLYYENLGCDVLSYNDENIPGDTIRISDGVFLLIDDPFSVDWAASYCRKIKPNIPIAILAHKNDMVYERLLVERKINFIFIRPFPFRQMSAEMRFAIFQQKEKIEMGRYHVRDLEIDLVSHQVKKDSKNIYLRNKEFSLLHFLMANKGKVLTRTEILENVWDRNANILTNTVDVHISQLRKKIDADICNKYIHTIPCTGYIFE